MSGNCTQAAAVDKQGRAAVMCMNWKKKKNGGQLRTKIYCLLVRLLSLQLLLPERERGTLYLYSSFAGDSEVSISDTQKDCVS